ncbi:hypothetical protein V6N13_078816 [Hibiscus sabdariffa]
MEYVEPAVSVANCLGAPLCKYFQYHRKLNDYVRNFNSIRDKLNSKMEDIELQLKAELLHPVGKIPKKGVQNWLEKVKAMIGEALDVETKVSNGRYLCRARNGKLVDEKTREMQTILDDAPNVSESLVIDGPHVGFPLPTSELVGEKAVRDEIWKCLRQEEVSMIGIWGMGGVGKTTIMKHIHNDLLKEPCKFDKVIWVTISKDFNIIKLQDDIASALNLKKDLAEEGNTVRRAAILLEMLKKTGKYVVILDDVWDRFSLEEVGIPEPSSSNGCKLVLTTRSKQVCNRMGCKDMLVRPLSEEEALILFLSRVGPNTVQSTTIMPTLRLVVNECAGLPLTVVVVAGTLKGEDDPRIWKNALNELKRRIGVVEGVETEVIERLKFSFDHLKDMKVKLCFLYCALYPEDFEIRKDELIECWIDEGFIDEMDTRQEMKDRGHAILKKLEDNCLLENAIGQLEWPCVKMHDAVRDMALSITSMPNLSVLNLSFTNIESLPDSISELKNLTALLLGGCQELRHLPCLSKLQGLKKLDLKWTDIEEVPEGMDMLINLRYLDLQVFTLNDIPAGLLSKFCRLQHLKIDLSKAKAGIEEIMTLENLECFEGRFEDWQKFSKFVSSLQQSKKNLIQYRLVVSLDDLEFRIYDKSVIIIGYNFCEGELIMLPFDVQYLKIHACQNLRSLTDGIPCLENVIDLRVCTISDCQDIEYVVSMPFPSASRHPFQSLERLDLYHLPKLREVIKVERIGSPTTSILAQSATFAQLKVLHIWGCSSMKTLFLHWLLPNLQNLEEIQITHCRRLIQILGAPTSEDEENESDALIKFSLVKLRELKLKSLPELEIICSRSGVMVCDSLRLIDVDECYKLKRLPPFVPLAGNGQPYAYAPPSLVIRSSTEWQESLEWDDPSFKSVLQPHFLNR